jgi:hypothetical protein
VARRLNAAGYRTRENAIWRDSQVARILNEPAAKGTYFYNTTRRVGDWKYESKPEEQWSRLAVPPVISEDLWYQASLILGEQEKKSARPGKVPVRLFAGLTVCQCGKKMYVPSGSRKYTCTKCKTKILGDDLEAIFHEEVRAYFDAPERISACLETARANVSEKQSALSNHQREIQKVRDEMNRTHQLYLKGQVPLESFGMYHRPLEERLRQLQDELPRLEAECDHLTVHDISVDQVVKEARTLYAKWPSLKVEEKQRIVRAIAERITVGRDEIEIKFSHLPASEELTKNQQLV